MLELRELVGISSTYVYIMLQAYARLWYQYLLLSWRISTALETWAGAVC